MTREISDTALSALANPDCTLCLDGQAGIKGQPCGCVWREIFRRCIGAYRNAAVKPRATYGSWSMPAAEYRADVELLARKKLSSRELQVFRLHYLSREGWRHCTRALRIDKGTFYHAVYRVADTLGRAFWHCSLYPIREYAKTKAAMRAAFFVAPRKLRFPKLAMAA